MLHRQLRDASAILVPTPKSLDLLPTDPSLRSKVHPLHYGIHTTLFRPEPQTSTPQLHPLPRQSRPPQGHLRSARSLARIAPRHPEAILQIAGSGPEEEEVRSRVLHHPARARIHLLGLIAPADVPCVLNQSTVYCLPSVNEPFGMTALEAMACGKPVIGTRSGGLGLLLDDAGSFRVTPGSVSELAAVLEKILSSPELQRSPQVVASSLPFFSGRKSSPAYAPSACPVPSPSSFAAGQRSVDRFCSSR